MNRINCPSLKGSLEIIRFLANTNSFRNEEMDKLLEVEDGHLSKGNPFRINNRYIQNHAHPHHIVLNEIRNRV